MELELTSVRLLLSPLALTDFDLTVEMFTDPAVTQFVGGAVSVAEIAAGMSNWIKRGGNGCIGIWRISDRETEEEYGSIALLPMPIDEDDTDYDLVIPGEMPAGDVEIGYFLKRTAWGKGFSTEACRRLLKYAFEESTLPEIVATFDEKNEASRNVLLKVGFVNHGTRRCYGEEGPNYRLSRLQWLNISR